MNISVRKYGRFELTMGYVVVELDRSDAESLLDELADALHGESYSDIKDERDELKREG